MSDPTAQRHGCSAMLALAIAFGASLAAGCGRPLPPAYSAEQRAAATATARGDHEAAALSWERAAERAPDPATRDEALYRRAASLERAGRLAAAERAYAELA
ncbi:MAG: hypothetical protein DIU78_008390, partial [Pseudomonadota bacterium]